MLVFRFPWQRLSFQAACGVLKLLTIEAFRWWLAVTSALLLILGTAPFSLPEAGWVALIPSWLLLRNSVSVAKRPFRYGYVIGFLVNAGTLWWISNVSTLGAIFLAFYMAVYPAIWFYLVSRFFRTHETILHLGFSRRQLCQIGGAACIWVTLEWIRSWFLTGFNWNELGHSQAESIALRQLAAIGGVPLVSFFLVMINLLWADGLLKLQGAMTERPQLTPLSMRMVPRLPWTIALAVILTLSAYGWSWLHLSRHNGDKPLGSLKFVCIQPNIPQNQEEVFQDYQAADLGALKTQVQLTQEAAKAKPLLILWPESTTGFDVFTDAPFQTAMQGLIQDYRGNILFGSVTREFRNHGPSPVYNSAIMLSSLNWPSYRIQRYNKMYLVVLGEYVPLGNEFPILREWLGLGMDFTRGVEPKLFQMEGSSLTVSPLICFEDTVPDVVDQAASLHPSFLATISDDAWYRGWCATWGVNQHMENARFRCVEHDLPMIRCGNNGVSCLLDQNGQLVSQFRAPDGRSVDEKGIYVGEIAPYPSQPTLYEKFGSGILLIFNLFTLMFAVRFFMAAPSRL